MLPNGDLGINASANNWADSAAIQAAGSQLSAALTTLRSQAQSLSSNLSTVQIRQEFTKAMINTLTTGADQLTLADSNEEGANLLGAADQAATVDHGPIAGGASRPERPPAVPITRSF